MWGGNWWGGLAWAGYIFDPDDIGTFTLNLDPCFDQALGYGGDWYGGMVYAGAPFCLEDFGFFELPPPKTNVRNICIIDC